MSAVPQYLQQEWPTERVLTRYKLQQSLCLIAGERTIEARCLDVSEGGLGSTTAPLTVGDEVGLKFRLFDDDEPMTMRAIVRHASADRCGFEFLTITPEQRQAILTYVNVTAVPKRPKLSRRW